MDLPVLEPGMVTNRAPDFPTAGVETWIEAARRGDREALGQALSSFRNYLLLMARDGLEPWLAAKGGASDLVQDTFIRAHRSFGGFRGRSEAEWRGWLRAILVRRLAHHRRRYGATAKRRQAMEVPVSRQDEMSPVSREPTPSRELVRLEREAALLAAVERLPEAYCEVVLWHHRDRLTFEEVGRRRGISAEAARKRWARALFRLKQELGAEFGSP
jgi:RNA polymerase sigma-70 factor (ECF subfamily)